MPVFVDTGAWFAASVPSDPDHGAAAVFLSTNNEPLFLSDFIMSELLTLFRACNQMKRAKSWKTQLQNGHCTLVRATDDDLFRASEIFFQYEDKLWSFTDCLSRVMMERLGIVKAFAFDDHFRQFGTVTVVP